MNRHKLIKTLAMTILSSGLCLLGGPTASAATPFNAPTRSLAVGQSLRYDAGLKLTFVQVRNDSRCPINARCISAGNAEVVMIAKVGSQPEKIIRLQTHNKPTYVVLPAAPPGTISTMKTYYLKIGSLNPLPIAGTKTKQSDYRLVLDIDVAN
jgi:hypothetical protein